MAEEEKKEIKPGGISRREFLKDASLVVGGAAVGSMALVSACGDGGETTKTVTNAVTKTVTSGAGTTSTVTVTAPPITKIVEVSGATNIIKLTVNKKAYEVEVKPNTTLQDMLREQLGFMSPKDMCFGYGACGSCSVIMDGRPILSCMALAIECDGKTIETAEGIADAKHPIVDAYIVNHCMQCGYCTPGFIVTAKALLDHNPKPTEADIRDILAGNICRCGTYPAHIRAVLEAAAK